MNITTYLVAAFLLLTSEFALSAAENRQPAPVDPAASLRATFDQIRHFQNSPQAHDATARQVFIDTELMPQFAFTAMSHWIAGPYARYMTPAEKTAMAHQLSADIKAFLSNNFQRLDLNRSQLRIQGARYSSDDKATVIVQVYPNQSRAMNLSFRMQLEDQHWKMADIRSFGTSLTMYYRARYIDQLRSYRYRSASQE